MIMKKFIKSHGDTIMTVAAVMVFLIGCTSPIGNQGGSASIGSGIFGSIFKPTTTTTTTATGGSSGKADSGSIASITQPGNPSAASTQNYGMKRDEEMVYSQPTQIITETKQPDGSSVVVTEMVPAGSKKKSIISQNVGQVIGPSQKDTSGETAAHLASFKGIQWVGVLCFLGGIAGFFHPVVRTVIGGKDTAMALGGAGLVMMFGPSLFVAYQNYFFLALLGVALYWFWSRSKHKEGKLEVLEKIHLDTNSQ